jgi:hypothetical protein
MSCSELFRVVPRTGFPPLFPCSRFLEGTRNREQVSDRPGLKALAGTTSEGTHMAMTRRELKRRWREKDPNRARQAARRSKEADPIGYLLSKARENSKKRNHPPPTVTREFLESLWEEQQGRCFWTDVPMVFETGSPWKISLERLDNSKPYTPENVVLCSWFANVARGARWTAEEFFDIMRHLQNHNMGLAAPNEAA